VERARRKDLAGPLTQIRAPMSLPLSLREVMRRRVRNAAAEQCASGNMLGRSAKARAYIQQLELILRSSPEIDVSLTDVAYILDIEKTYCSRVFRQIAGASFCGWKRRIRIERAKDMLHKTDDSITKICHAVGYRDVTTFERNFLREVGTCPRSFRKLLSSARTVVAEVSALTA
jgi:AraC-like DNA-binding protein